MLNDFSLDLYRDMCTNILSLKTNTNYEVETIIITDPAFTICSIH